jgi:hypothetical protein
MQPMKGEYPPNILPVDGPKPKRSRNLAPLQIEAPASVLAGLEKASEVSGIAARTLRQEIAARLRKTLAGAANTINPQAIAAEILSERQRKLSKANGNAEAAE